MERTAEDPAIADCARAWTAAVAGLTRRPESPMAALTRLTHRLVNLLHAQPFAIEPAYEVGTALVSAGLSDPEVLGRTIDVLDEHLACLGADPGDPQVRIRLVRILGAIGTGFARALRDGPGTGTCPLSHPPPGVRLPAMLTDAAAGVALGDPHGRLIDANGSFAGLLDYAVGDLIGRHLTDLVHPEEAAEVGERLGRLLAGDPPDRVWLERRLVRRDGAARWTLLAMSQVRHDPTGPEGLLLVTQDVTDHHRLALKLRHQAFHDPLTGLPNRALFAEQLDRLWHTHTLRGARAGLCFVDLDGFKAINDELGHQVGDVLLAAVADRVNRCVTAQGHILARIGGDEFVILVAGHAGSGATTEIADEVLRALAAPFRVGDREVRVSASIGIAERTAAETTPLELLWDADVAMRRAKTTGKGRWALFDINTNGAASTVARSPWPLRARR